MASSLCRRLSALRVLWSPARHYHRIPVPQAKSPDVRSRCCSSVSCPCCSSSALALAWSSARGFSSEAAASASAEADSVSSAADSSLSSESYPLPAPPPGDFEDFPDAGAEDDDIPPDDDPAPDPDEGALFSPSEGD